jgi:predicted MFS family arabinose efflux permease
VQSGAVWHDREPRCNGLPAQYVTQMSVAESTHDQRRRGELGLLLTLASVHFTHIVDYMIMMPLGPQFMRLFDITPQSFSVLVSAYTFAASASGFVAAFWIDRFDHKRALLFLYSGFIVATGLCGLAPSYGLLLAARVIAGVFGGVIGGLVFTIVADAVPYSRRARATAIISSAFSLAAVAGVPLSIWLAVHLTWRAPFLALAATSVVVGVLAMRLLPPMSAHLSHAQRRAPVEQLRAIFGDMNHLRAFSFMVAMMFAGFMVIPFIAPYYVTTVGIRESDLASVYFVGGLCTLVTAQVFGRLADRYGKKRVFTVLALASIVPILITTHMPRLSLSAVVVLAALFFIFVSGRFGPAMALVTGSVEARLRGSFMSFNASIQQLSSGLAALVAGAIITRGPDGSLVHYGVVGWLAVACTLVSVWLAHRISIRGIDAGSDSAKPLAGKGASG